MEALKGYTGGAQRFRKEINAFVYGLPSYYNNALSNRIINICRNCEHSRARRFRGSCPVVINPFEDCERISEIIKGEFLSLKAIEARLFAEAVRTGEYDRMRDGWARARRKEAKAQNERVRSESDRLHGCFIYLNLLDNEISIHQRMLREEYRSKAVQKILSSKTTGSSVCSILQSHSEMLKDDPDRLSTDFLKNLIGPRADGC